MYATLSQIISFGQPQIRSVICSQPFLLDYENLPSSLNFSAQFINVAANPSVEVNDFIVKLGEYNLTAKSVAYNESTRLYDVTVNLPSLQKGKYILKLIYGQHESVNFKGVNVYQYTGNFSFIHWTDLHYDPPKSGYESQLNATLQLLKNANPEFILMTGDLASSEANYQRFYAILKSIDFDIPIFFSNGNHEKESIEELNNAVLYMGEKNVHFENEYPFTFNYGNYHFINLDSGVFPYSINGNISDYQLDWLKTDLQSNQGKDFVACCHHPLCFTGRTMFWSNISVANNVLRVFSDYGVMATFAGHAHKSDVTKQGETTYYTTVSGHNETNWVGNEPFPPSGFRTINVIKNKMSEAPVTELFSYYTGEFVYSGAKQGVSSESK
jgi:predicted MPP superfamily phosphohydrolase